MSEDVPKWYGTDTYENWFNNLPANKKLLVTIDEFEDAVYGYHCGDYIPFRCLEFVLHYLEILKVCNKGGGIDEKN